MRKIRMTAALAGAIGLALSANARAAFLGPYTTDADTLHLWHMDEASGQAMDSAGTLHLTNIDQSAEPANATAGNTPATANVTYGNASFTGLTNAMGFANNALIPNPVNTASQSTSPQRPILVAG